MPYEKRLYREYSSTEGLVSFTVNVKETDLFITSSKHLKDVALQSAFTARKHIESYIAMHPEFLDSLIPMPLDEDADSIVQKMLEAASASGVGPMAAVAGAVGDYVGTELLQYAGEVIVENGGDLFLKINRNITVAVFAGQSPLSEKIGLRVMPSSTPFSLCTSSGRVGPSLSFGTSDAVTIKSSSAPLADAAATAIGNIIHDESDIPKGIETARKIKGVEGVLIVKDKDIGVWGDMELMALR